MEIKVIMQLARESPLSFRALGRRLHANNKRLKRVLERLVEVGIVEVHAVTITPSKKYKFYSLNERYLDALRGVLRA